VDAAPATVGLAIVDRRSRRPKLHNSVWALQDTRPSLLSIALSGAAASFGLAKPKRGFRLLRRSSTDNLEVFMGRFSSTAKVIGPSLVVAATAPLVLPAFYRAARPVVLALIKAGILLGESMKEGAARMSETVADMTAEVQASHEQDSDETEVKEKKEKKAKKKDA
jgi:hypothetical protein